MAAVTSEMLLKTYKTLATIPTLVKARFTNDKIIESVWTERNLERGKLCTFQKTYISNDSTPKSFTSLRPIDVTSKLLETESPCKKFNALIREVEHKQESVQYLEVWDDCALIRCVDLNALDIHGKVYTDDQLGCFKWSPDSSKLLYVAEKKEAKVDPLHKREKPKKVDEIPKNGEMDLIKTHSFKQDWGEGLVGKIKSVLVVYDLEKDEFILPNGIPENIFIAYPLWTFDGKGIIGICYNTEPRKLGLIYFDNRESSLFSLSLDGEYTELSLNANYMSVNSPVLTPDGKHVIFLQTRPRGPHGCCFQMRKAPLPFNDEADVELLIDYVDTSINIGNGVQFYGLFNVGIPKRCWTNDSRLIFYGLEKNYYAVFILNIDNGNLTKLIYDNGSQIALDVWDDKILIKRANFFEQDLLLQGKIPPSGHESSIVWEQISQCNKLASLNNMMYKYLDLSHDSVDSVVDFTAIYIGPQNADNNSVPLILYPHGGPHSANCNLFMLDVALHLTLGYAVLFVNYRGSTGAGKKSLEFLLGKVGDSDVQDCLLAMRTALETFPWLNPKRLCLVGGSHGGFLVTHLSGQYPELFRAVVARNPVVNIAAMSTTSDSPDWCYVEAGSQFTQKGEIDEKAILAMLQKSPIVHADKVKAPTLLQIGTNDLRVPPSQGIDYYFRLKANNIPVCMNMYNDNHPIRQVPNEIDFVLSTAKWLQEHNN